MIKEYKRRRIGPYILKALQEIGGSATKQKIKEFIVIDTSNDIDYENVFVPIKSKKGTLYIPFNFDFNFGLQELYICGYIESYKRNGDITLTESGRAIDYSIFPSNEDQLKIETYWEEHREGHKKNKNEDTSYNNYDDAIPMEKLAREQAAKVDWKDEILELIKKFSPQKFESFSRQLLAKMGIEFDPNKGVKMSGDHGIDGYGYFRSDGFRTSRVVIQCKKYTDNPVSEPEIDKFKGAMNSFNADYGIFITTSHFTNTAKEKAMQGGNTVTLIDGQDLGNLIEKYELMIERTYSIGDYYYEKN